MIRITILILALLLSANFVLGQIDLTENVLSFSSDCIKVINPEDEQIFIIDKLSFKAKTLKLDFTSIANCGAINKGIIKFSNDTLYISKNNHRYEVEETVEVDALGGETVVNKIIDIEDIVMCDCKFKYSYLINISRKPKYLHFNKKMISLSKTNKRN